MRAGGCTVQQALTAEAASIVKQAVTLARRRGHAQVTPLHVANTMLSASTGLLRTACLQSHCHPLQCKALELCFNVALNRLPSLTSTRMLGAHLQYPAISNALVAAFKRAQAHKRRGLIENQQQPLLAVKIELKQLIISILDDPSVSRVMREAGFSSTQVKSNVEQAVSLEICSQNCPVSSNNKYKESNVLVLSHQFAPPVGQIGTKVTTKPKFIDPIRNEDVMYVIENLMNKRRRNFVIVGEFLASVEGVFRGVMEKVDKGDVPEALRDVKFIPLSLSSFRHQNRVEVEQNVEEIKSLVRSYIGGGVVLNFGDLEWVDYKASSSEQGRGYYCSLEHVIMEIGKLVCAIEQNGRFWLMGIATFQTYMRCRSGHPSLETLWGLHPLTIPAGSLSLSLITDSDVQSQSSSSRAESGDEEKNATCCADCWAKFDIEARGLQSSNGNGESATSSLPAWLQQYKDENVTLSNNNNDKDFSAVRHLCKKRNSICNSIHKQPYLSERTTLSISSVSHSSFSSGFSYDHHQYPNSQRIRQDWSTTVVEPQESWREHHLWFSATVDKSTLEPSFRMYIPEHHLDSKQLFSSNPNSTPNSACSSDVMEMEYVRNFKALNSENVTTLCNALEKKMPRQKDIIPEIVSTVLKCRSGMLKRKGNFRDQSEIKKETWLFFQGVNIEAKEKIAKELAQVVFGSHLDFVSIALRSFSSTRADSTEDSRNKRSRDEQSCSYIERFAEAVLSNPHRVFFVQDVERADYFSKKGFKRAIESGRIKNSYGNEIGLSDAIIILSCESFSSRSRACSPPVRKKSDGSDEDKGTALEETSPSVSLDLNMSFDDDSAVDQSIDDIGLLESVDKRIIFELLEL